jgi:RNA polymerase sigma-70 factor (ECF subfamily)
MMMRRYTEDNSLLQRELSERCPCATELADGKHADDLSQSSLGERCSVVDVPNEAVVEMSFNEARVDLETIFHAQYERLARVIAGVTRDPARAEELAVEVFLKWSRHSKAQRENAEGWLYRTAIRTGLDELRRQARRSRYERLMDVVCRSPSPHDIFAAQEEQQRVRVVLSALEQRQAELVALRSQDLSYEELASALDLNPASVGTLLSRAQQAFRKEYEKRYGQQ